MTKSFCKKTKKINLKIFLLKIFFLSLLFFSCAFTNQTNKSENELYETLKKFVKQDGTDKERLNSITQEIYILIEKVEKSEAFEFSEKNHFSYFQDISKIKKTCNDFYSNEISFEQARSNFLFFILEFYKQSSDSYEHISILIFMILTITFLLCAGSFVFIILFVKSRQQVMRAESIIQVQEIERNRLSYELHDTVAQDIRAEQLFVNELESRLKNSKRNRELVEKINLLEKRILRNIRLIIKNLSLPKFDKIPFAILVEEFCKEVECINDITCSYFVQSSKLIESFNAEKKLHIFRIVQEAINNSIKHSFATEVSVQIREDFLTKKIVIFISDNGNGFDVQKAESNDSFGLRGMKSRANTIHAELNIDSEINSGTTIKLELKA